jgi:hypothetical protein
MIFFLCVIVLFYLDAIYNMNERIVNGILLEDVVDNSKLNIYILKNGVVN